MRRKICILKSYLFPLLIIPLVSSIVLSHALNDFFQERRKNNELPKEPGPIDNSSLVNPAKTPPVRVMKEMYFYVLKILICKYSRIEICQLTLVI